MRTRSSLTIASLGTILSVWAHPDDETYLAGGLMALARDQGQRVVCVSMTAGEHGTPDPAAWPPARLGAVRRWEATAAMAVLGVTEHRIAGLPDGGLDRCDDEGRRIVAALIDDVRPDTILTFGPDGATFHPDHVAVHRWVSGAWDDRGRPGRLLYAAATRDHLARFGAAYESWGAYMSDARPVGVDPEDLAVHAVLGGRHLDRKLTALRAMWTQTAPIIPTTDPTQLAEEAFLAA
jgi:LmbE family N-acetylglucosaminyl deacetylase